MTEVVELKSKLDELNEKQRQHSADIIRAEVDRENAKAKLTEAASMLNGLAKELINRNLSPLLIKKVNVSKFSSLCWRPLK